MQRKVAYVFLYKNGIRERSVGIVRRYGTAEQPEVALELFGEEERQKRWRIYYFTGGEALVEATYLWGSTTNRGKSEARLSQCRLCAEAGMGEGVVLLPENAELREYLCARYDGKEITEEALREAFLRKPESSCDMRIESAKKLMEEITKAAGGEVADETAVAVQRESFAEGSKPDARKTKRARRQIAYLEKLLLLNPPYGPCRRFDVEYSVRVTPEELLKFPKEGKRFAENSFVLHAYYRYRHVLLGRRRRKTAEDYVLLVPGSYNEKEARLAELFGFPEFLPLVQTKPEAGGAASGKELFGYFCGKI